MLKNYGVEDEQIRLDRNVYVAAGDRISDHERIGQTSSEKSCIVKSREGRSASPVPDGFPYLFEAGVIAAIPPFLKSPLDLLYLAFRNRVNYQQICANGTRVVQ